MAQSLKLPLAILSAFTALASLEHHFPQQMNLMPPWAYLDGLSDRDLYSYLLARRFSLPHSPRFTAPHLNWATGGFFSQGSPQIGSYSMDGERVVVQNLTPEKTEEQTKDVQSRDKNGAIQPIRSFQQDKWPINPRFLFNFVTTIGSTNSYYNPFLKTIYYFTTATTTITSTTTCITTAAFRLSSYTVICRKRRELMEILSVLNDGDDEAGKLASIAPTSVKEVIPTVIPFESQQIQLTSSKNEDGLSHEHSIHELTESAQPRVKRFFASTTTVITYVFSTVTSTRTLSSDFVSTSSLSCRPSQFTYC